MNALLAMCRAAPALEGVAITDGPVVTDLSEPDRLFVGWAPGLELAAQAQQDFASAGARRRDEGFDLTCYLESRSGDTDLAVRRARVYALQAVLEDLLRATDDEPEAPTLRGTVQWAHLTSSTLTQPQTTSGALAGLTLTITCRARL
jgi:hypothetical protein